MAQKGLSHSQVNMNGEAGFELNVVKQPEVTNIEGSFFRFKIPKQVCICCLMLSLVRARHTFVPGLFQSLSLVSSSWKAKSLQATLTVVFVLK